jgi:hypothetical protein
MLQPILEQAERGYNQVNQDFQELLGDTVTKGEVLVEYQIHRILAAAVAVLEIQEMMLLSGMVVREETD